MLALLKALASRWVALYFLLYVVTSGRVLSTLLILGYGAISHKYLDNGVAWFANVTSGPWGFLPWIGVHVFHEQHPVVTNVIYSDTPFAFLQAGVLLVFALIVALVWTWFDRSPNNARILQDVTRVAVRYALAVEMCSYGFEKIFPVQFPYPEPSLLMTPLGGLQPSTLMWTFMGYSSLYQIFGGLAELTGATLVLFRRTTTLGALVIAAVMTNVLVMNLAYDVPVKLWAAQLILMAIFLAAPDALRVLDSLVLYRPVPAIAFIRLRTAGWVFYTSRVFKVVVVAWVIFSTVAFGKYWLDDATAAHNPDFVGLYQVTRVGGSSSDNRTKVGPGDAWQRLAIDRNGEIIVRTADDVIEKFSLQITRSSATGGSLTLTRSSDNADADTRFRPMHFRYVAIPEPANLLGPGGYTALELTGVIDGIATPLRLDRIEMPLPAHRSRLIWRPDDLQS